MTVEVVTDEPDSPNHDVTMAATWWSEEKISATVNQSYIEKELGSRKHRDTLYRVLAFGDGLTDDTYLDWILERSPRFFLILNDIGLPEKVFEVIDRSFDDDDLPLSQDALWELNLFGTTSETLDKKFYRQQFHYLIQELEPGGHVDYGAWDVVPVERTITKPNIATNASSTDRVFAHDHYYTRKRIPISDENGIDRIRFIMHLKHIAAIQHRHLVTVWATYSQNDYNFVLLKPSCDITLKHILEDKDQAKQFRLLEKDERRHTLLTWMHCLTSGLAYLHSRGFMHKSIRPSTISVDHKNVIHLNDYNALRVLDVDEPPNPYSGEIYEYAAPENWQRKPRLHETAPLKTTLPGGGRTARRLPKPSNPQPESRRPSLTGLGGRESVARTHSRSQNSSSGSSTTQRPRNALITTFQAPDTTPTLLPGKYFPSDIFSLSSVLLTLLSYILGHSPKSFASHRSRLNRQAGRGNAPPDASFHKNLPQVGKWIDSLIREAGHKEKKDQKLWGGVVELLNLVREGLQKEQNDRIEAEELDNKVFGWVEWAIARQRKCNCSAEEWRLKESDAPNPIVAAQRDSILSWSKISERISDGLEGDYLPLQPTIQPRRSLSQRLSLDRNPELRRSRHQKPSRPTSSISGHVPSLEETLEEPRTPTSQGSKTESAMIRSAVRQAVATTSAPRARQRSNSDAPAVVHQGRSAYRIKPKKAHTSPTSRHVSHPIQEPIREEEPPPRDVTKTAPPTNAESAYCLRPPRSLAATQTHPLSRHFSRTAPQRPPQEDEEDVANFSSFDGIEDETVLFIHDQPPKSPTPKILHGHPAHHASSSISFSAAVNNSLQAQPSSEAGKFLSIPPYSMNHQNSSSATQASEVWGLGTALEENEEEIEMEKLGSLEPGSRDPNWPLPLGTLVFEGHHGTI